MWEQHLSALEQQIEVAPGLTGMRESALGGPETCSRARVVWQVRWSNQLPHGGSIDTLTCSDIRTLWPDWVATWQGRNRGFLRAGLTTAAANKNPCIIDPESRYRGPENQLYRVEVHRSGFAQSAANDATKSYATFKWSRDNGSVLAHVAEMQGDSLTLDCARGFEPKTWVELTNRNNALNGVAGALRQIKAVDGDVITLDMSADDDQPMPKVIDFVRRWDQQKRGDGMLADDNAVPIVEGTAMALEHGIEITFEPTKADEAAASYRTGDYWLIPARMTTGSVEWPTEAQPGQPNVWHPQALPPQGITHHYAPLAIVSVDNDKTVSVKNDCRCVMSEVTADSCPP